MDLYLSEPVGPFPTAASAAFNTFTTKQNVSSAGTTPVISGNKLRAGSKLQIHATGNYSTTGTPTLAMGFWIGTRALAMTIDLCLSTAVTGASGAALIPWIMRWDGFCTVAGVTGSLLGQGWFQLGASLSAAFNAEVPMPITAALRTVAIDTTIERAIGCHATYSASSVSNAVVVDDLRVLILN